MTAMNARHPGGILIADDNKTLLKILSETLLHRGYDVDTAENGREVLAKLSQRTYRVVLLDVHMPEMDGIAAAREIKTKYPQTYVVIMTGEASDQEIKNALGFAGHYACLRKPFGMAEFAVMMKHLEEESQEYRQSIEKEKALQQRPVFQKAADYVLLKIQKALQTYKKPSAKQWLFITIMSLIMGLALTAALEVYDNVVSRLEKTEHFMQRIEGYLQRDERRELQQNR